MLCSRELREYLLQMHDACIERGEKKEIETKQREREIMERGARK
uniref:Uncharacterized protein n=1 Tax=Arundo donax TaxID=35708 RepID=A0A0A8ZRQ6_ARUDO